MWKLIAVLCLASSCAVVLAQSGLAVTKAYADDKGFVHIVTENGRDHIILPKKWQDGGGFEDIQIAPDRKTVGWLVNVMLAPFEGGTSYANTVSPELDVWRGGRVIVRSGEGLGIQNWIFLKGGNEVAFHRAPPHGQEQFECTLLDVNTGKEVAHWELDRKDYLVPDWAKPLVGDSLPSPDQIHYRFPDEPAKSVTQPKQ
jgi:hypothetical protein